MKILFLVWFFIQIYIEFIVLSWETVSVDVVPCVYDCALCDIDCRNEKKNKKYEGKCCLIFNNTE